MTRKRKQDERNPNDNTLVRDTPLRQRRTSESLNQSRESNSSTSSINVEGNQNNEVTFDSPKVEDSGVIPDMENTQIENNQIGIGGGSGTPEQDPPIRKSHRISKLRKANVKRSTATATPLSPPTGTGIPLKNQSQTHSSSSSSANLSTNNLHQAPHLQNSSHPCHDPAQTSSLAPAKPIRKILVWRENDTRWFFEALCEHGKDFHHIQSYIASKYEKKGIAADLIKNYENVRHYYYRMWHKVCQLLKLPYEIEKNILETYGLINYGELWKRVGSKLDMKLIGNLQQLVIYGFTAFKVKGKMFRVRTPVCNALKRIHNIQVPKPRPYQIPKEIIVEIVPETNRDWIQVQKLAQNPRLRTKLTLQHRLSSLIDHLERRWSKENVLERAMQHLLSDPCEDLPKIEQNFFIRLKPKNADKILTNVYLKATGSSVGNLRSLPSQNSNLDLSLSSFLNKQKLKKSENDKEKCNKALAKDKSDTKDKEKGEDELNDAKDKKDDNEFRDKKTSTKSSEACQKEDPEMLPFRMFQMLDELNEKCAEENVETIEDEDVIIEEGRLFDLEPNDLFEAVSLLEPPENMTLVQWLDCAEGQEENAVEAVEEEEKEEEPVAVASKSIPDVGKTSGRKRTNSAALPNIELANFEAAKRGWTRAEADSLSIGELYLLVGCPEKIQMEYSWNESKKQDKTGDEMEDSPDVDEDIFDTLAFCANALLASFKKPPVNQSSEGKESTLKSLKLKSIKPTKKVVTKKAQKIQGETGTEITLNSNSEMAERIKNVTKIQASAISGSALKVTSERLPTSGVRVQPVSQDKVKEALADLYSNSQNIFRRNNSAMKSPLKPSTPRKDNPVEFVVSLGPSFVQNLGQGTFQIQSNDQSSSCASPKSIIPIKFIPTQNPVQPSNQEQQTNDPSHQPAHLPSYQPFSRHQMFQASHTKTAHQPQQSTSIEYHHPQNSINEFGTFLHQTPTTNNSGSAVTSQRQSSSSTWLNEFHSESSMSSLLAACDLMSQENACHKPRDV